METVTKVPLLPQAPHSEAQDATLRVFPLLVDVYNIHDILLVVSINVVHTISHSRTVIDNNIQPHHRLLARTSY